MHSKFIYQNVNEWIIIWFSARILGLKGESRADPEKEQGNVPPFGKKW